MSKHKTVYLAGKISDHPNYRAKFNAAAKNLEASGHIVLSPAILPPEGFEYEAYIRMSMAMLVECDVACFLPDWKYSRGAVAEYQYAKTLGKGIMLYAECFEPDSISMHSGTPHTAEEVSGI